MGVWGPRPPGTTETTRGAPAIKRAREHGRRYAAKVGGPERAPRRMAPASGRGATTTARNHRGRAQDTPPQAIPPEPPESGDDSPRGETTEQRRYTTRVRYRARIISGGIAAVWPARKAATPAAGSGPT